LKVVGIAVDKPWTGCGYKQKITCVYVDSDFVENPEKLRKKYSYPHMWIANVDLYTQEI